MGVIITIIARVFTLIMPSYVNKSITVVETFMNGDIGKVLAKEQLLHYILIIIGAALLSDFLPF